MTLWADLWPPTTFLEATESRLPSSLDSLAPCRVKAFFMQVVTLS